MAFWQGCRFGGFGVVVAGAGVVCCFSVAVFVVDVLVVGGFGLFVNRDQPVSLVPSNTLDPSPLAAPARRRRLVHPHGALHCTHLDHCPTATANIGDQNDQGPVFTNIKLQGSLWTTSGAGDRKHMGLAGTATRLQAAVVALHAQPCTAAAPWT